MGESDVLLGGMKFSLPSFPKVEEAVASFDIDSFRALPYRKRFEKINLRLLGFIEESPIPAFLLPAVVEFITLVNEKALLGDHYQLYLFEFWLIHYLGIDEEEKRMIRAKIAGKLLSREEYQAFFPIGMGTVYDGTHFVAAHLSPDVDTTIASFWGWVDAFAAEVSNGMHVWCLPGGPPESPVTNLFKDIFGNSAFQVLARYSGVLSLTALDLLTNKNVVRALPGSSVIEFNHGYNENAILLVDEDGCYVGDWRKSDLEAVRRVTASFKSCLYWFENLVHIELIAFFASPEPRLSGFLELYVSLFEARIEECEPATEFSKEQVRDLDSFFQNVLQMKEGIHASFSDLFSALKLHSIDEMFNFREDLKNIRQSFIFDDAGNLIDNRPRIFSAIQMIFKNLDNVIQLLREHLERLDIVMGIKGKVLGRVPHVLSVRSSLEDIKLKIKNYDYLTVAIHDNEEKVFPIGVVWKHDLFKSSLGTVSFRDFCNLDEVHMSPYLDVISIIDHHKSSVKTSSVPLAMVGDTQSCNVLVAEISLAMNQKYSCGGMELSSIDSQINLLNTQGQTPKTLRIIQNLLNKKMAAENSGKEFIDPQREMAEYFFYLHAILDDTDLLNKVTVRDVECVAALLNAMKTLVVSKACEIIDFDDIPRDRNFPKKAAQKILQNPDMYSLYRQIYVAKEAEMEKNLLLGGQGKPSDIFSDTKVQNSCCRISQTKIFGTNIPTFKKNRDPLMAEWLQAAKRVWAEHPDVSLHIHMVSTIPSAAEVYENRVREYTHQDEFWIWIPQVSQAEDLLASFLSSFQTSQEAIHNQFELELSEGSQAEIYKDLFKRNFLPLKVSLLPPEAGIPDVAVLKFYAGTINSRKASVTPYLPKLVGERERG